MVQNVRLHDSIIPAHFCQVACVDINKLMNGKGERTNYISCAAQPLLMKAKLVLPLNNKRRVRFYAAV